MMDRLALQEKVAPNERLGDSHKPAIAAGVEERSPCFGRQTAG
jgi:hypothetical protein